MSFYFFSAPVTVSYGFDPLAGYVDLLLRVWYKLDLMLLLALIQVRPPLALAAR